MSYGCKMVPMGSTLSWEPFQTTWYWSSILRYLGNQTLSSSMVSKLTLDFQSCQRMVLSSTSKVRCYWFFRKRGVKLLKCFQARVGHFLCKGAKNYSSKGFKDPDFCTTLLWKPLVVPPACDWWFCVTCGRSSTCAAPLEISWWGVKSFIIKRPTEITLL